MGIEEQQIQDIISVLSDPLIIDENQSEAITFAMRDMGYQVGFEHVVFVCNALAAGGEARDDKFMMIRTLLIEKGLIDR